MSQKQNDDEKQPKKGASYRAVCFTLNNYTLEECILLKDRAERQKSCKYLCFQKEVGKEGTPHLQGYAEFSRGCSFKQLKALLGDRAHFERRQGTNVQARDYCRKEGGSDFTEVGTFIEHKPGKRNDLDDVRREIDQGRSLCTIQARRGDLVVAKNYETFSRLIFFSFLI